ncbi:MAG: ergothioneine biosynthesis protein EgtC [Gammaproteobacteria bacterium]|nr:ergothioneine biosynthesis protein EgtC [Gammaproteobacteria bacterium]MDH5515835.1 ergothioneine biosynthesis protein EgtC [Gammaproteobacteria bacterium]
MCRHAAYLGPAISLQQFLIDPPHSLYQQSWNAQELKYARLNADGYGFGWFNDAGKPATYTSAMPIWSDHNLVSLAGSMKYPLWVGEIRSATIGNPVHAFNTQPFQDDRWLFVHNGFVRDFHEQLRPSITAQLSPAVAADIRGNTDSEYLFALFRQILLDEQDIPAGAALRMLFSRIGELAGDTESLLNLLLTDGTTLYASRHAINHESPSLYFTTSDPRFPQGQLVASEAFDPDAGWQRVPEHHLLMLTPDSAPALQAL